MPSRITKHYALLYEGFYLAIGFTFYSVIGIDPKLLLPPCCCFTGWSTAKNSAFALFPHLVINLGLGFCVLVTGMCQYWQIASFSTHVNLLL